MKLLTPTPTPPPPIVIEFTREEAKTMLCDLEHTYTEHWMALRRVLREALR